MERKKNEMLKTVVLTNTSLTCFNCKWRYTDDAAVLGCELYARKPTGILNGGSCDKKELK